MKSPIGALCVLLALVGAAPEAHAQTRPATPTERAAQTPSTPGGRRTPDFRFSVSTTYLSLANFESEATNLHHYEVRVGYQLSPRDRVELKATTWKLFEPMGIPLWDPLFREQSEWYPGRLRERGLGVTYQRLLPKGLFAQLEVLPVEKTYLDKEGREVGDGFRLYTTYHVGYHLQLLGGRLFVEPQVHLNYWPLDSDGPEGFAEVEDRWHNYFLFEPNLYIGVRF